MSATANLADTADSVQKDMQTLGQRARRAARRMSVAEAGAKNAALFAIADNIEARADDILAANKRDVDNGRDHLDAAMLERLTLNPARIAQMAEGLRQVAALADPVGEITDLSYRPSGIQVGNMR